MVAKYQRKRKFKNRVLNFGDKLVSFSANLLQKFTRARTSFRKFKEEAIFGNLHKVESVLPQLKVDSDCLSDEETINAAVEKQKRAIYAFCRL
jgi:hypothetical protein